MYNNYTPLQQRQLALQEYMNMAEMMKVPMLGIVENMS